MLFHLFIIKFILVILNLFLHNNCYLVKEARLIDVVDDLDFEIRDVAFEANVFNKYGTFD